MNLVVISRLDVPPCEIDFKNDLFKIDTKFHEDYDKFNIWDLKMKNPEPIFRAYSMANHPAEGNIIMLNIRLATPPFDRKAGKFMNVNPGICSSYVFSLKPGDKVNIAGPFGDFHIKPTKKEMIYIGGGAGMAPLRSHLFPSLPYQKRKRKKSNFLVRRSIIKRNFLYRSFQRYRKRFPEFSIQYRSI